MLTISIFLIALVLAICWELYKKFIKLKKRSAQVIPAQEIPFFFTEEEIAYEKEIRKKWLTSYFGVVLLLILSFFNGMTQSEAALPFIFLIALSIVVNIPWCWITYHCAYKKKGTRWLLWNLISMPLAEVIAIIKQPMEGWGAMNFIILGIALMIEGYYLFNSYQLRKLNLEMKNKKSASTL